MRLSWTAVLSVLRFLFASLLYYDGYSVSRVNLENCVVWFCLCSLRLVNFDYQCSNLTWSLEKRCIESYRSPPFQNYRVNLENARRARWEAEARQVIEQISKKCPGCQTNIEKNGE